MAAGHRSQRSFAEAIGVSETSVANAERGSDLVGALVYGAIEVGLKWPEDSTTRYLETGRDEDMPGLRGTPQADQPEQSLPVDDINEEMLEHLREQRLVWLNMDATDDESDQFLDVLMRMWKRKEPNLGRFRRTLERFREEIETTERDSPKETRNTHTPNG